MTTGGVFFAVGGGFAVENEGDVAGVKRDFLQ